MNKVSKFQIDSCIKEAKKTTDNILKILKSAGINKDTSFDIKLCLDEALINAIAHGNKNNKCLPIKINYSITADKFSITIEDSGCGFDYKDVPDPTQKNNLLKTQGRGVYLIRRLMDEVSFNKAGNKITMVKYLKGK